MISESSESPPLMVRHLQGKMFATSTPWHQKDSKMKKNDSKKTSFQKKKSDKFQQLKRLFNSPKFGGIKPWCPGHSDFALGPKHQKMGCLGEMLQVKCPFQSSCFGIKNSCGYRISIQLWAYHLEQNRQSHLITQHQ